LIILGVAYESERVVETDLDRSLDLRGDASLDALRTLKAQGPIYFHASSKINLSRSEEGHDRNHKRRNTSQIP
jgi:hypothetical protein